MTCVLYVEDQALQQAEGDAALRDAGYQVLLASDGEGACAQLRAHRRDIDALVTDIDLTSSLDGWQVAAVARGINAGLPVLYVSGAACADFEARRTPGSVMIPKPFRWSFVLIRLAGLLDRGGLAVA
jgi:two-component system, cell cycle response regulator CpdR